MTRVFKVEKLPPTAGSKMSVGLSIQKLSGESSYMLVEVWKVKLERDFKRELERGLQRS